MNYLLDPKTFKLFIGLVLLYIGARLFGSAIRPEKRVKKFDKKIKESGGVKGVVKVEKISLKSISFDFWGGKHSFPHLPMFLIAFVIGIIGGAYRVMLNHTHTTKLLRQINVCNVIQTVLCQSLLFRFFVQF